MKGVFDPSSVPTETLQVLRPDGTPTGEADVDVKEDDLREMWRLMTLARRVDREATNLQRQGELGVYTPLLGQEAAQIGSAYALESRDWIFPSYRELAPALMRGIPPAAILHLFRGTVHGGMWDPREHNFAPYCVPVGTQVLHAAGFGIGAKIDGSDVIAMVYFGDGATSEGDFHEGCNFAGVWKAGVVFVCQNNQYAISVPLARQTAAPTIAAKAIGYGFPGVRVDGNDVLAVHHAAREAVRRAREGQGPTLIECVTYRMGPHSTADDPTRYRTSEELQRWEALDPLNRFRAYLDSLGALDEDFVREVEEESEGLARDVRREIVGAGPLPAEEMFRNVTASPSPALEQQIAQFRRHMEWREGE